MRIKRKTINKISFNQGYARIIVYQRDFGTLDIDKDYQTQDGFPLGAWIAEIRQKWMRGQLPQYQEEKLELLGISMDADNQNWESMYMLAKDYYDVHGSSDMSIYYKSEDGALLGAWLDKQKRFFCYLSEQQKRKLDMIGVKLES